MEVWITFHFYLRPSHMQFNGQAKYAEQARSGTVDANGIQSYYILCNE